MPRWAVVPCVVVFLAAWGSCSVSWAQEIEAEPATDFGIDYSVAIEGVENSALRDVLLAVSETHTLQARKPASVALLRKRAREDLPRLDEALDSWGYYDATVAIVLDDEQEPAKVLFAVALGEQYTYGTVEAVYVNGASDAAPVLADRKAIGLLEGAPARARPVISGGDKLVSPLRRVGFPFPKLATKEVWLEPSSRTLNVKYIVDPGPYAVFGATTFLGLERVKEPYVRGKLPWAEGDPYNIDRINDARVRYADMGVFDLVRVTPAKEVNTEGALPVEIEFTESLQRTIAGGLSFQTDEGPGVLLSWEHRNLTGRADTFKVDTKVTGIGLKIDNQYTLDDYGRPDQRLKLRLLALQEDIEAYESQSLLAEYLVERDVSERWTLGAGLRIKSASVEQLDEEDSYAFLAFPFLAERDTRDDLLDPHHGGRLSLEFTPYVGSGDAGAFFMKSTATYRHYAAVSETLVLAGRITLGSIYGADQDKVPIDERFYSGGGSSLRGYDYRTVSPLVDNDPIGGRSVFEVSFEARKRLNDAIGLVLFIDGGSAFEDIYPDFGTSMRWGAGVGVRVYTPAGPFRLDVAVPLNRRDGVDDAFQLYASFGHTF